MRMTDDEMPSMRRERTGAAYLMCVLLASCLTYVQGNLSPRDTDIHRYTKKQDQCLYAVHLCWQHSKVEFTDSTTFLSAIDGRSHSSTLL